MPPRRRPIVRSNNIASRHLTNQFYEMKKTLHIDETCPICLESLMECKYCYILLTCGHAIHSKCWFDLEHPFQEVCPVCKC